MHRSHPVAGFQARSMSRARISARLAACGLGLSLMMPGLSWGQTRLSGQVRIDGSSTVAPITMATAELFRASQPRVRVTVGISGTGGGFKKFLADRSDLRTDISDASRPIKKTELARAARSGVEFIEVPIAIDGVSVVVHAGNHFCDSLTIAELKRIWEPASRITNWKQVRKGFPDLPMKLYGPGTDNGTFDYFTHAIVGKEGASRSDYTASATPNVLVQGIAGDRGALGYFGYSYYAANKTKLKVLAIDNGDGHPIAPSLDVIRSGKYRPLSRPLFLYINKNAAKRPEVVAFLDFFFDHAKSIVEHPSVNYVALSDKLYDISRQRLKRGIVGSAMAQAKEEGSKDLVALYGDQ